MSTDKATDILMTDCGLKINCGRDGAWLHFSTSDGKHASINVESMARGGFAGGALLAWCKERRAQAEQIRAASNG